MKQDNDKPKNILFINSSIQNAQSHSVLMAEHFIKALSQQSPTQLQQRNLAEQALPQLDNFHLQALFSGKDADSEQKAVIKMADDLLAEVEAADMIVIALPMYNFNVPSQFKVWMDYLARAGVSFRYTEKGPEGMLTDKPVYIFAARGGFYANTEHDHQTPFVKQFFSMIGLNTLKFVYAEGLNISEEQKQRSIDIAFKEIERIVSKSSEPLLSTNAA